MHYRCTNLFPVSSALYLAVCEAAGEKPMTHRR